MSCCYCGKRVSLVRKRVDADFCCDEHREKYHARTRRSIETLRQADEHIAVTRRLNEGVPAPALIPQKGRNLDSLLMTSGGAPIPFETALIGLPNSRPNVNTYVPGARLAGTIALPSGRTVPAPRKETVRWSIGAMQEGPRPPQPFTICIRLPQGGPKKMKIQQAACDRPRRPRYGPDVELGSSARVFVRTMNRRTSRNALSALMRSARPPAPVKPPPATPPIVVTLRHPTMSIRLGNPHRAHRVSVRMPEPGMTGLRFAPPRAEVRPPAAAYVPIMPRELAIPAVGIAPGSMPGGGDPRGHYRSAPCPEGFRRRQYYASEPLERFCGIGFQTIAAHRPEIKIAAAPSVVAPLNVAAMWAATLQDPTTAEPERRRPAPPFRENLCLPPGVGVSKGCQLGYALPGRVSIPMPDSRHHFPTLSVWDVFGGGALVRHQGGFTNIAAAGWATGTAEALGIPSWAKAQNRGAKRTGTHLNIGVRQPAFSGPAFAAGRRQAGPVPEKPIAPPVFAPVQARVRSQSVVTTRAVLLPVSGALKRGLRQMAILTRACQAPVGHVPAASIVHPAYPILLPVALPPDHFNASPVYGLDIHPPARQNGLAFDIAKGVPERITRLALERFRRRGYEAMHSRHSAPNWPSKSTPRLLPLAGQSPRAHAAHEPEHETAMTMYRSCDTPAPSPFRRTCSLMYWGTEPPSLPGCTDWGRAPHLAGVALPRPFVLPIDSLGPIRDWGLAPPPEPEKPPEPIHEDFAAGLANWVCANADWRQDIAGVRTGSLALLRPSLNMGDYELEFLGKIENQSIGWVFRAANTSNYHAVRMVRDAAAETVQVVRFTVLAGERETPIAAPLQIPIAQNASCRVKMSVNGTEFKLFINDKAVLEWDDDRLPEGGVGFFSDGDDRARLYWVKVTPFYETLSDDLYQPIAGIRADIHREIRMGV